MNKAIAFLALFVIFASSAMACKCVDTDEQKKVPVWGDNEMLGGTSRYYLAPYKDGPEGCTGKYGNWTCKDVCLKDSYTLREFYCKGNETVSYIYWNDYENSEQCGYEEEIPEFGVLAAGAALIGALGIVLYKRK